MDLDDLDQTFRPLGKHSICLDGDILWMRSGGAMELAEQIELVKLVYGLYDRFGYILVLGDATHSKPNSAEVRRHHAEEIKKRSHPSHTALYGAHVLVRGLLTLAIRGIELVTGKVTPISFHPDEASAREILATKRRILAAKPK
jgi:hypothetical protein